MTSVSEAWPEEFRVEVAAAAEWVERAVGAPAHFGRVLRNKLWGFTATFGAGDEDVVLKIASPPLFPAAHRASEAAHRAAPEAVPQLLGHEERDGQSWSLFRFVDGVAGRIIGADAVFAVIDIVAGIQAKVALDLPAGVPVVPAASVCGLLTDLSDLSPSIVDALDQQRERLSEWGQELDSLVPLSLDHVDLHLGNVIRTPVGSYVLFDWEEAVVSCPLFSFERLRFDATDHGVARLAEQAYARRLLPNLDDPTQRRVMGLARALAPLKLAHEARAFAKGLGWSYPHTELTTHYVTAALDAAAALVGPDRPRRPRPNAPEVAVAVWEGGAGGVCREVLDTLPTWFGLPDANAEYIASAQDRQTLVASLDNVPVGLLVPTRHADAAAEIHLLAVAASHRRKGIGRALVDAAEALLRSDGVTVLQVKTLSARRRDDGYEETRAFYRGLGFVHLEEHPMLWDESNPALQMVKSLAPFSADGVPSIDQPGRA